MEAYPQNIKAKSFSSLMAVCNLFKFVKFYEIFQDHI